MAPIPPLTLDKQDDFPSRVDVVVIGGGIIGVSTALSLAERGISVVLFEKGVIGGEQSSRNWGWVRQMGRSADELPLAIESLRQWEGMGERVGNDVGYRRTGITYLCDSERQLGDHDEWLKLAKLHQLPSGVITRSQLSAHLPGMKADHFAGVYTKNDGRAEPALAAPLMAKQARKLGAHIVTGCAVRGVETSGGKISGVVTERGRVDCQSVVLAGGAWSRLFAGNTGIDIPQLKILASAMRVDGVEGVSDMPVGASNYTFRRRVDGGFTVALRNANIAPITPDSFRLFSEFVPALLKQWRELKVRVNGRFIEEWNMPRRWKLDAKTPFEMVRVLDPAPSEALNRRGLVNLAKAFPAFANARISHQWGGLIDVTPDGVPVIGPVDALPGFFIATGFSGHGFGIGPGSGRLMAEMVLGKTPFTDPAPFRFGRFAGRDKINNDYLQKRVG